LLRPVGSAAAVGVGELKPQMAFRISPVIFGSCQRYAQRGGGAPWTEAGQIAEDCGVQPTYQSLAYRWDIAPSKHGWQAN
jgi:hypothetical protein